MYSFIQSWVEHKLPLTGQTGWFLWLLLTEKDSGTLLDVFGEISCRQMLTVPSHTDANLFRSTFTLLKDSILCISMKVSLLQKSLKTSSSIMEKILHLIFDFLTNLIRRYQQIDKNVI